MESREKTGKSTLGKSCPNQGSFQRKLWKCILTFNEAQKEIGESINRENKCLKPGFSVGREEGLPLEGIRQCLQILLVVIPKGRGTYNKYQPPLLLNILPCTGKPLQNHPAPNVNEKRVKAAQSCPALYSLWDSQARILEWVASSPRDLPNPEIKPRSPALQADFLPAEPLGKSKDTGVGSLSLLQGIFLTQESNQGLLHCRWILYQLSYQRILVARKRAAIDHLLSACWKSLTLFFLFFVNE